MNLIPQIKNLIEDIEKCSETNDLFLKHTELVKLILKDLPNIDRNTIELMNEEDMLSDIFYELDESSKIIIDFIFKNIAFMEEDLKGSDFEAGIKENTKQLEELQVKLTISNDKYKELKKSQKEITQVQFDIDELQLQLDEYKDIDLEQMRQNKIEMKQMLEHLHKTEGKSLIAYKKHLQVNKDINIKNSELSSLSDEISEKLKQMDDVYSNVVSSHGEVK